MNDLQPGQVNIRGKVYETVALRVHKFRDLHPDWTMKTSIIESTDIRVVMTAKILDETGRLRANGHAEEVRKSSQINKTSALENCETSAIGRALAALGLGGTEFASANEVQNAIHQQNDKPIEWINEEQVATLSSLIEEVGANETAFLKYMQAQSLDRIQAPAYKTAVNALERKRAKT